MTPLCCCDIVETLLPLMTCSEALLGALIRVGAVPPAGWLRACLTQVGSRELGAMPAHSLVELVMLLPYFNMDAQVRHTGSPGWESNGPPAGYQWELPIRHKWGLADGKAARGMHGLPTSSMHA